MKRFCILACILVVASAARAATSTTQPSPSNAQMQQRVQALEARIAQLQAHQTSQSAEMVKAVDAVLADADANSGLGTLAFPNGYDPNVGFVLQSPDGNFSMHPGALVQFRYVTNYRENVAAGHGGAAGGVGDDTNTGFELGRLRFSLDGNVFSPLLTYYFQVAQDTGMSNVELLDAYLMYRVSPQSPLALKIGQFKDPVWHEQNLYPSQLMAVDRSLVNELIGGGQTDRVQGAALIYDQDRLRGQIVVDNGYNSENHPFYQSSGLGAGVGAGTGLTPTQFGISGRGEYLLLGNRVPTFNPFSEYDQFTAMGDKQDILIPGFGFDYSQAGSNNVLFHTLDAQYNTASGWAFYGAYLGAYRRINVDKGVPHGCYYDAGFELQAAYMLSSRIEPFARYDYTQLAGDAEPGIVRDTLHEITVGVNYYFYGQHAKFTLDGSWLPNGCPADLDQLGILEDDGHNEFVLRAQVQLQL